MIFHSDPEHPFINQLDSGNTPHKIMNIYRTIFSAFAIVMMAKSAIAAEYNMTEINQKIKAITDKRLHLIETALDEDNLFQSQELLNLQQKCSADWVKIIENLNAIDSGDEGKKLIIYGLGQLAAQDYMTVIESLVTKYENGAASEQLVNLVLFPMGRMSDFLTDNFSHVRVVAIINRIKAKSSDAAFKGELDNVLSGRAKSILDNFREAHAGLPEGSTEIVILPP
jgi:hypothetical protein